MRAGIKSGVLIAAALLAAQAVRAEALRVATTASAIYVGVFVAKDKGYFAAHGLDVTIQPIALTSTMPAALVSGSVDIAGPSTPVFIQAVDGGLDLVALAGSGLAAKGGRNEALVTSPASPINGPADLVGRRVAIPGIGTLMDVMLRHWLMVNQVDPRQVSFIEVGMAQMADALRGGSVDAAALNDPTLFRIVREAPPHYSAYFMSALPGDLQTVVYLARRDWAEAHRDAVTAFQAANREGTEFVTAHPEEARAIIGKYLKVSDAVLHDMELPQVAPEVTAEQLRMMVDMMREQDMLRTSPAPDSLIFR